MKMAPELGAIFFALYSRNVQVVIIGKLFAVICQMGALYWAHSL